MPPLPGMWNTSAGAQGHGIRVSCGAVGSEGSAGKHARRVPVPASEIALKAVPAVPQHAVTLAPDLPPHATAFGWARGVHVGYRFVRHLAVEISQLPRSLGAYAQVEMAHHERIPLAVPDRGV